MSTAAETRTRRIVRARSGGLCEVRIPAVCSGEGKSMHHRKKAGRVWCASNVLHACGDGTTGCHGWIEANPNAAHERGLWLMGAEDSLQMPVVICWRGITDWFLLSDYGGLRWPGRGPLAEVPDPVRLQR